MSEQVGSEHSNIEEPELFGTGVLVGVAQRCLNQALERPRTRLMLEQAIAVADEAQRSITWEGEDSRS